MMTSAELSFNGSPILIASLSLSAVRPPDFIETLLRNNKVLESEIGFVKNRSGSFALRYLLGRALMRYSIGKVFPGSGHFNIVQSESGKPYLSFENGKRSGWFSISHCDQEIVVAVSGGTEIGVDIEKTRHVSNAAIAHLTQARPCDWLENNTFSKEDNFLIHWVMYEAYVKAMGCGATLPFQSVKFSPLFDQDSSIPSLQDNAHKVLSKYVGAFASHCSAFAGDNDFVTQVFQFGERHWLALSEKISDYITITDATKCDVRRVHVHELLGSQMSGDIH